MALKSEQSTGEYYKKLGDTAFAKKQFDKAAAHYAKGLRAYPFISIMRNAKATLKHTSSPELGTILSDLEGYRIQFLTERAQRFIELLKNSGDKKVPPFRLREEFYGYPYTRYTDIIGKIQSALGEYYLQTQNQEAKQLFFSLGKYNPNSPQHKAFAEAMFQELRNSENPENAMYDLMNLLQNFHELIEDKLPEIAKSIKDILENSIDFNERRWAIFTLEVLGEKNLNLIQDSLKILNLYLNDPQVLCTPPHCQDKKQAFLRWIKPACLLSFLPSPKYTWWGVL